MKDPARPVPDPGLSDTDDSDQLVDALLSLVRASAALAARSLAGLQPEVTLPQYRILAMLDSKGPQRVADVATELKVRAPAASRMCDRLERRHLLIRRTGFRDRREVHLHLTLPGAQLLAEITNRQRTALASVAAALPAASPDILVGALRSLAAAADDLLPVPETADASTGCGQARSGS